MPPAIEPVYLPHNEPYLGQPHLLAFDQAIPDAMRANLEVARRTFVKPLSSLQIAATVIIAQDISIALSIRELIRSLRSLRKDAIAFEHPSLERFLRGLLDGLEELPDSQKIQHRFPCRKSNLGK